MTELSEAIKAYLEDSLTIEVQCIKKTVKVTLLIDGEVITSDSSSINTSPIVYGAYPRSQDVINKNKLKN